MVMSASEVMEDGDEEATRDDFETEQDYRT